MPDTGLGEPGHGASIAVGRLIRSARERAVLTQEALAGRLGVTQSAVSHWEAGKRLLAVADRERIADALGVRASSLLPAPDEPESDAALPAGQFKTIAFFGHIEHTGYVTEIVKHGQPAYHIDLPEKIWGGNPLAYREYAASAWFSEWPVTEESVRKAWEAERARAGERRRQAAAWEQQRECRELSAGTGDDDCICGPDSSGEDIDINPECPVHDDPF